MRRLSIDKRAHVFVLTGAGISAESGIPTFRGSGGLWENHPVEQVASPQGFIQDPALVWRFYSERRAAAKLVKPNPGHFALARLEEELGEQFLLATQNIDGLHQMAGSRKVIEMHGTLWKSRCSRCDRPPFADDAIYDSKNLPGCAQCQSRGEFALLRPHIVWFGEMLASENLDAIEAFFERARHHRFIFMAIGTSGRVSPASLLVDKANALGADSWLINAEEATNGGAFENTVIGKSGEVLPSLLALT